MPHTHSQPALIDLPASKLLDKFGEGNHRPGSGSAASLMGILSGKLILTVCKLSLRKPKYKARRGDFELIISKIESEIIPQLLDFFHKDADIFDAVIQARIARESSTSEAEKKNYRKVELDALRIATEIPLGIGSHCLRLIDHAVYVFDSGFQSARGDSGAAVSAAIAGVSSAAFVINLNLRSFGPSKWKDDLKLKMEEMLDSLQQKQLDAFSRITKLTEEEVRDIELDIISTKAK